jgi:hypothetical protein
MIKLDGVPANLLEETLQERNPATGKSRLPWIEEIFSRQGARLSNFYVRGISLSAPSWAMLDSGQHQRIHGNVEYDRFMLRPYDYLNFVPFYLKNAAGKVYNSVGAQTLDASGVRLLIDYFPPDQRYQSFQMFQRGVRWLTLRRSLAKRFTSRSPRQLFDEYETGFEFSNAVTEQNEREVIAHIADNKFLYLDYFTGDFDHIAHLTNDRAAQIAELQQIDNLIGRVWNAIRNSPLANETLLVIVSDHGINSTPGVYSQGYNLVDWLRNPEGGAHHTITDRYPLDEYKLKGLNPLISEVISPSSSSLYLKGESEQYPTALLDLDGNERAALQLRNSDLNALHILLKQIARQHLSPAVRAAATNSFFDILDLHRNAWARSLTELREELAAAPEPDRQAYSEFVRVMSHLVERQRRPFDWEHLQIDELIPKRSLGEQNTIYELQNYVTGPSREGLVLDKHDPSRLDLRESLRHLNYFAELRSIAVRNNVQKDVGTKPVDFVATQTPQGIWLYADDTHQALIQSRTSPDGSLELRCVPVSHLRGEPDGSVSWSQGNWSPDLPMALPNDFDWHTDLEWLAMAPKLKYSNGIVGLHEQFLTPEPLFEGSNLARRFEHRRRQLVQPDLILFANDHWNFNVRGFNPGGNHGSFFQASTRSILMFAGGELLGVPHPLVIDQPYDSLSLVPTILTLLGKNTSGLPGPVIRELMPVQQRQ